MANRKGRTQSEESRETRTDQIRVAGKKSGKVYERIAIGRLIRKWREIFNPITKHGYAKLKQMGMTFDTQVNY